MAIRSLLRSLTLCYCREVVKHYNIPVLTLAEHMAASPFEILSPKLIISIDIRPISYHLIGLVFAPNKVQKPFKTF